MRFALWISAVLSFTLGSSSFSAELKSSYAAEACESHEKWQFSERIPSQWRTEFLSTLQSKHSPARAFSEALALRKLNPSLEAAVFAEYWISRALLSANILHIAQSGFLTIASRPLRPETLGIQAAAMHCLAQIAHKYPTLRLSKRIEQNLFEIQNLPSAVHLRSSLWEPGLMVLFDSLLEGASPSALKRMLSLFESSGAIESFAHALYYTRVGAHSKTTQALGLMLQQSTALPDVLKRYQDSAHLLKARAHYSLGEYEAAIHHFKQVRKSSNTLAQTLSELSWAYLQSERYGESIGTAINLQSGALRKTFMPEAPMVMAMALNELCQFPEAIKAINIFKKHYKDSYFWLKAWSEGKIPNGHELYPMALAFLRRKDTAPEKVAGEWVRSPLFIARQDEINLFFEEKNAITELGRSADLEQQRNARELLEFTKRFKKSYALAKVKLAPGQALPQKILDDLERLKSDVIRFQRFRAAAPTWRTILSNHERKIPTRSKELISEVNKDLKRKTEQMLVILDEIAENNSFIEVEILNGASQDIIWQNAYPDYKKIAQQMKDDGTKAKTHDWNWGSSTAGFEGSGEIWEDELGSFKAELVDNCTSKEKYLAIKRDTLRRPQAISKGEK
jgi:tetratricopeptide (TPR) repeat protein